MNSRVAFPYASLSNYIQAQPYQGTNYPVLPIWNSTQQVDTQTWRNSVLLYDRIQAKWALVYQYDYAATAASQKNGWPGSWGPIVETFQNIYTGTNAMGALNVQIRTANPAGIWSGWADLTSAQASLRADNVGFHQDFLDPNYDWLVSS